MNADYGIKITTVAVHVKCKPIDPDGFLQKLTSGSMILLTITLKLTVILQNI